MGYDTGVVQWVGRIVPAAQWPLDDVVRFPDLRVDEELEFALEACLQRDDGDDDHADHAKQAEHHNDDGDNQADPPPSRVKAVPLTPSMNTGGWGDNNDPHLAATDSVLVGVQLYSSWVHGRNVGFDQFVRRTPEAYYAACHAALGRVDACLRRTWPTLDVHRCPVEYVLQHIGSN